MTYSSELVWDDGMWFVEVYLGPALICRMPMADFLTLDVVKMAAEEITANSVLVAA